jgi:deoxycytidine triphosphate deaminase
MRKTHDLGSVLSYDEISRRLDQGEIFQSDSWSHENIRAAAYDLRMADDLLVIPDPPEFASGRRYNRGERRTKEVILKPGDVAFVSSLERLCMPWDLSGILGPKFSLTARGILILTGIFVDPGYGLIKTENGKWVPKDDQRLHFLLANVGPDAVVFVPGKQRIAAIQFCKVAEPQRRVEVPSVGFEGIERDFFDTKTRGEAGLVFFRNMTDVQREVAEFRQRIGQFDQQIGQFNQRLSSVESGSNQILMFGVYLLCATILGVSIAVILSLISNLKVEINWTSALVLCTGFLTLGWIVRSFMKFLHPIIQLNPKQSKNSKQLKKDTNE